MQKGTYEQTKKIIQDKYTKQTNKQTKKKQKQNNIEKRIEIKK